MTIVRGKQFHMLLTDDELDQLRCLADAAGLSASDWLRCQIRKAHQDGAPFPPNETPTKVDR